MGRKVDLDDLVAVKDIAERADVNIQAVHNWLNRDIGFPEPVLTFGQIRVWLWPDVRAWLKQSGRV